MVSTLHHGFHPTYFTPGFLPLHNGFKVPHVSFSHHNNRVIIDYRNRVYSGSPKGGILREREGEREREGGGGGGGGGGVRIVSTLLTTTKTELVKITKINYKQVGRQ